MAKAATIVLVALCAGLGIALAVQRGALNDTRQEVDELRARLDKLETRQKEAAPKAQLEEVRQEAARAERKAAAAYTAAEAAAARPAAAPAKDDKLPLAVNEEDLQKIVDARIEEKLQAKGQNQPGGNDRKLPLHDISKELALDPAVQAKVATLANTAKKEIFDILKTPRPDGTNAAEDLVTAFTSGDTQNVQKLFAKLFTENIPGTQTTYVAAVARVQEKANQGLAAAMGPDAFGKFQHMNVKPENIETGFDPWSEYLQQRGK